MTLLGAEASCEYCTVGDKFMALRFGLVVPALAGGGGVPAVARFIKDVALRDGRFELLLVSLSSSASDVESLRVTSPSSWRRGASASTGVWEDTPYVQIGVVGGEFEFQRYRRRKILTRTLAHCDLIQVVCGSPAWANAVTGLGKPVALQVATLARVERRLRDANPNDFSGWWRRGMTVITSRMDDCALRSVDAIQVENSWMLDYARSVNAGRDVDIRYAPPGVDAKVFCPLPARDLQRDPYILCVGRLHDTRKNIALLLEAYACLSPPLVASVRLVLAGSCGPPDRFWRCVNALGLEDRVSYIEQPDQAALVRLYQQATVFALPSDEEGLGVVLLEAMACGVPVVSTRSGGPDEIVTDGEDGYLVPRDDAAALSLRLEHLLLNPKLNMRMGQKARRTIDHRYAEHVAGEVFVDTWDRMMHTAGAVQCAV